MDLLPLALALAIFCICIYMDPEEMRDPCAMTGMGLILGALMIAAIAVA